MPRIVGVDLPKEKRLDVALNYIYGIGPALSRKILAQAQMDPSKRAKDLTDDEVAKLSQVISSTYKVEGDLRRDISANVKRLIDIGSYRGFRHRRGLPVRGQRTHTNARTRKGPRRILGGGPKKPAASATAK